MASWRENFTGVLNQSEMNTNKETFRLADYKNIPMKTNTEGKQSGPAAE